MLKSKRGISYYSNKDIYDLKPESFLSLSLIEWVKTYLER